MKIWLYNGGRISSGERKPIADTDITYGTTSLKLDVQVRDILELKEWGLGRERRNKRVTITHLDQLKKTTDQSYSLKKKLTLST